MSGLVRYRRRSRLRRALPPSPTPNLEPLEPRVLLSVTPDGSDGLTITGDDSTDAYVIGLNDGQVVVAGDSDGQDGTFGSTRRIALDAGGGDDSVVINTTDRKDKIKIKQKNGSVHVVVKSDGGKVVIELDSVESLTVNTAGGDDRIRAAKLTDLTLLTIDAGSGNDRVKTGSASMIYGRDGDDRIKAGRGDDTIDAGAGDDRVKAGPGDDTVSGGAGVDVLKGQKGTDTVTYQDAPNGVVASLVRGDAEQDGHGSRDRRLKGFENLTGSNHDDQLEGDDGKHTLTGLDGIDLLMARKGRTGTPTIYGRITDERGIASLSVGLESASPDQFVNVLDLVDDQGLFEIAPDMVERILGGPLGRTERLVQLRATDLAGNQKHLDLPLKPGTSVILDPYAITLTGVVFQAPFDPSRPLADGEYEVTATATDVAGNTSDPSAPVDVIIDTTAPAVRAASLPPLPDLDGDGLPDGEHRNPFDVSGLFFRDSLLGDYPVISGVDLDLLDSSDTGLKDDDDVTSDNTPQIMARPHEAGMMRVFVDGVEVLRTAVDPIGIVVVDWSFIFGETTDDGASTSTLPREVTLTLDELSDGEHEITATISDPVSDELVVESRPLTITIDTTPPPAPTLDLNADSDTGFSDSDNITKDNTPAVRFDTPERGTYLNELTVDGAEWGYRRLFDFDPYFYDSPLDAPLPMIANLHELADGEHHLTATAIDLAGNVSGLSDPLTITIDTVPPLPPVVGLLASSDSGVSDTDNLTNDTTPSFAVTAEHGSLIELFVNGTLAGDAIADGAVTITPGEGTG